MIEYVKTSKLIPHPKNPRKDLGDLTELADGIKAQGVLQNLTVVPPASAGFNPGDVDEGSYVVVIGHRRLEAAKLAGLGEVPCSVSDMGERQQVETMLIENMQRSGLTAVEQARGFQMMLDMGETAETIAEKTGFSETTVKRRLFIASLPAEKAQEAHDRGATLEDYMKLQQVGDANRRAKVLDSLGTQNFGKELRTAIAEELRDKVAPSIIALVSEFASPTEKQGWELNGYSYFANVGYEDYEKSGKLVINPPATHEPGEYLYIEGLYGVEIKRRAARQSAGKKMAELTPEEQAVRREARRKYKTLRELAETAYLLRLGFVMSYAPSKKDADVQMEALSGLAFSALLYGSQPGFPDFALLLGLELGENKWIADSKKAELYHAARPAAAKSLLAALYASLRDSKDNAYFHATGETGAENVGTHKANAKLDAIYDCLRLLGYKTSDDELAMMQGAHEAFARPAPEEGE